MSEEDQIADVATLPKFDMPSYESEMTAKDVKALALRHGIPLDLHPVALTKGWTMDKLSDDMIGLYEQYFEFSGIRVPFSAFLFALIKHFRVHISQLVPWRPERCCHSKKEIKVAAKKRERKKQGGDGGEGSCPVTKRQKTAARRDGSAASEATSSPEPIRTLNLNNPSATIAETAESREDRSPRESPRGSADHSVHNYDIHHGDGGTGNLRLGTSGDPPERAITHVDTEVVQPSPSLWNAFHSSDTTQLASPLRTVQRGNTKAGESSRRGPVHLMVHLDPPAAQEESNALNNTTALERAWKLVQARLDVQHSSGLYNSLSDRFKAFRNQALRIKELEDTLAKKDSALVYAERINTERAQEREKLSHEYKESLSKPFNLAIQAGWGKGLAEERSEENLLELMGKIEGFDVYADKKMKVEYDKLFEKRYPYVE
ncbi:hypothetical protein Tco_0683079 [Tanacetum coccineum]|uniref:Uncharacterized protein n=1 Tax=Tanacetum coccineum TaxID=301880 RepID=A0ABQ4XT01_9ASTR